MLGWNKEAVKQEVGQMDKRKNIIRFLLFGAGFLLGVLLFSNLFGWW